VAIQLERGRNGKNTKVRQDSRGVSRGIPGLPADFAGTATVRSYDAVAKRAEVDADQLADAMLAIEDGKDLSLEQSEAFDNGNSATNPARRSHRRRQLRRTQPRWS
jgi:hypothetical protein